MGLLEREYLSAEQLKGFDNYKYICIDTSPLAVYVSHPFWNWIVEFYPRWLAPNMLTLGGWLLVMGCFLLESCLDYNLTSNSVESTSAPIPDWFWLVAGICTFAAHTMDGTDGKQARRIGASGPTGELFDHGLDSWSTIPFTITIFSVFGQGDYSISPVRLLCILISVQIVFLVTHWEKYNTGVMFLSWGYDASQYGLSFIYTFTYFVGYKWFKFNVFSSVSFAVCFEFGFYLCCAASLAMSLYNIYQAHLEQTLKQPSLAEGVRPIVPSLVLFAVSVYWAHYSPTNVISRDPRVFFFAMGTTFSNIACRLIIAQMSSSRAEIVNALLVFYSSCVVVVFLLPSWELAILRVSCLCILMAHVHYGVYVVKQLCDHFHINAFDVSYLQEKQKEK